MLNMLGSIVWGTVKLAGNAMLFAGSLAAKGVAETAKLAYNNSDEIGDFLVKTVEVAGTAVAVVGYGGYKAVEWGVDLIVQNRSEIAGTTVGAVNGLAVTVADSAAHAYAGEGSVRPLVERLKAQSAEYRRLVSEQYRRLEGIPSSLSQRDVILDTLVVGGETLAAYSSLAAEVPHDVEMAYQLAYPGLAAHSSFVDTVHRLDASQMPGLAAGVKGKLFEIKYADYLNDGHLPAGYDAQLASSATQPGWDIQILGPDGHLKDVIQAKATDSTEYVQAALERYPQIDVVTTSEVHSQLMMQGFSEHVIDSGISDMALQQMVDGATDSMAMHFDWMPSELSLALIAFSAYSSEGLDAYQKSRNFGERASKSYLAYLAGGALALATNTWWLGVLGGVGTRLFISSGHVKRERLSSLNQLIQANDLVLSRLRAT